MTTISGKLLFLIASLAFCDFATAQDYIDVQLPGKSVWLQYPATVTLVEVREVLGLRWIVEDEPSIEFGFGYIPEEEVDSTFRLINENVGKDERFIIEPRETKISSFDATESKVIIPDAAGTEDSDEVFDMVIHAFVIEVDGAFYMCDMYDTSRDHDERYTELFLRLCNSIRTEQP
jgi:hypothetical protein